MNGKKNKKVIADVPCFGHVSRLPFTYLVVFDQVGGGKGIGRVVQSSVWPKALGRSIRPRRLRYETIPDEKQNEGSE